MTPSSHSLTAVRARAGASAPRGSRTERSGIALGERQHAFEAGDLEDAMDLGGGAQDAQVEALLARRAPRLHRDLDARRVEELDASEVQGDALVRSALGDRVADRADGGDVDLAGRRDHEAALGAMGADTEGRHARENTTSSTQ